MKKENTALIEEFKQIRMEMLVAVQQFPQNKCTEKLFSGQSLKDLLAHITAWDVHTYESVESIMQGITPVELDKNQIEEFNRIAYEESKELPWEEVHENFVEASARVIEIYKELPDNLWDKKFWPNKEFTPRTYLQKDAISHYKKDHLPEIKAQKNNL